MPEMRAGIDVINGRSNKKIFHTCSVSSLRIPGKVPFCCMRRARPGCGEADARSRNQSLAGRCGFRRPFFRLLPDPVSLSGLPPGSLAAKSAPEGWGASSSAPIRSTCSKLSGAAKKQSRPSPDAWGACRTGAGPGGASGRCGERACHSSSVSSSISPFSASTERELRKILARRTFITPLVVWYFLPRRGQER